MWRAYKIPLPALVSADPYGTLCTPLLDRDMAEEAVTGILQQARQAGAHALILRAISLDGAAMKAFTDVLRRDGMRAAGAAIACPRLPRCDRRRRRIAARGAGREETERTAPPAQSPRRTRRGPFRRGAHACRNRRRRRNIPDAGSQRLEGPARHRARRRTTAMRPSSAAPPSALAETGQCEIVTLRAGETPVAAAIVLRHQDRAFYFKLGVDERFAKFSPGVQLTLDLTRHLCADPAIRAGRFHRRPRSSHDQPDLARTPCDRRRADPAAAGRSGRVADPRRARRCAARSASRYAASFISSEHGRRNPR